MEVVAHANLTRTYTAPPSSSQRKHGISTSSKPPPLLPNQSFSSSQYSIQSQHSSQRSSDTTQATSTSTLFAPTSGSQATTVYGYGNNSSNVASTPIVSSENVLNRVADKETSLFQICLSLRQRLLCVPNFEHHLREEEEKADEDIDPVTLLWRTFRRGYPLVTLYNAHDPDRQLDLNPRNVSDSNKAKSAAFKFLQACIDEFGLDRADCFILTDLYGEDTTGFVKVAKFVNKVLDVLVQRGVLNSTVNVEYQIASKAQRTQRQHIINELVSTERTYVQQLELLQQFKKLVEEKGVIAGDSAYDIFLNLNSLLDTQRRFLIRIEQTNAQPEEDQNWGKLFVSFRDAFRVYEPFIANQKKGEATALREFDKLKEIAASQELRQMVESPVSFSSFLLKPFLRLTKYPLLLKELLGKGDLDEKRAQDISLGIEVASSILEQSNAAIDRQERIDAVQELRDRVEDWKGHRVEVFGDLLLHGTYTVLKGENTAKDTEREYKIYLFENILLCCKEVHPNKQKNKLISKPVVDRSGRPRIQLKGRIFMQNVTETISLGKPGNYTCQIFWKGDPAIENFIIRFHTEEAMRRWATQVDTQRRKHRELALYNSRSNEASTTHFKSLPDQTTLMKAYRKDEEYAQNNFDDISSSSRASTSDGLDGGSYAIRGPPSRFPMTANTPPLSLRTQQLNGSQIDRVNDSYFSPNPDSPASSRASSSPSVFANPRHLLPNGWHPGEEYHSRHTAPAMARVISRDGHGGTMNGNSLSSRSSSRDPSLPPPTDVQAAFAQSRLRSASSPDIHNPLLQPRRLQGQQPPIPDLPPFPTHIAYASSLNRSQTSSPNIGVSSAARAAPHASNLSREMTMSRHPYEHFGRGLEGYQNHDFRTPQHSRTPTAGSIDGRDPRKLSPSGSNLSGSRGGDIMTPSQLKVKVHCPSAGSMMTLVVSTNISYQSLKDRIDAKLQRSTSLSLSGSNLKLKYLDDDDFVSIQSDEDVQTAFESWKEQQRSYVAVGQMGEIELYVQR